MNPTCAYCGAGFDVDPERHPDDPMSHKKCMDQFHYALAVQFEDGQIKYLEEQAENWPEQLKLEVKERRRLFDERTGRKRKGN